MHETVHKLSVRKTDRQIQATPPHPWFKLLLQQGTEPNCTSCIWSPPLGQELCTRGAQLTQCLSCACHSGLPSLGWGRPGKPLPVPCNAHEFDISLPLSGTAEQKLGWEQWPDCRAVGRCCLSSLLSDLGAGSIAPPVGWCKHSLRAWTPTQDMGAKGSDLYKLKQKALCFESWALLRQCASLKQEHWVPSKLLSRFHSWKGPAFSLHCLS